MAWPLKPGDHLQILVNQGWRFADVLAVVGQDHLLEYEMPNGTTALRLQTLDPETGRVLKERSYSYRDVPTKWLQAIEACGQDWKGQPQQVGNWRPKSVTDTLVERIQGRGL